MVVFFFFFSWNSHSNLAFVRKALKGHRLLSSGLSAVPPPPVSRDGDPREVWEDASSHRRPIICLPAELIIHKL